MIAAINDGNPIMYIDDRWLYDEKGEVPEEPYSVPIGQGIVRRQGSDITVVATSYMVLEGARAASSLEKEGIDVELIDVRSLKPLDDELIFQSVTKTGRLVIADAAWRTCGAAAEIAARVSENVFQHLKAPIGRVTLPDAPAPMSPTLEKAYYVGSKDVIAAVKRALHWKR